MSEIFFGLAVAVAAFVLVGVVRQLAIVLGVIDRPTSRGSHQHPTPRGGGLGSVVATLTALLVLALMRRDTDVLVIIAGCVAVAAVGWIDDKHGATVRGRLIIHMASSISVGVVWLRNAHGGVLTAVLCLSWMFITVASINLVNFMDGINGLVSSQIGIFSASLAIFGWEASRTTWIAVAVAAGCAGFLPWNFPRARIFLGDVGSGALGFLVPALTVTAVRDQDLSVWQVLLPLTPLYGDAIVTVVRRWKRRERLTQPHRSHIYQRLANRGFGHTRVTLTYAAACTLGAAVAHAPLNSSNTWTIPTLYVGMLIVAG